MSRETLNGGNILAGQALHGHEAAAGGIAIYVYGTRAAKTHAATEFRAGKLQFVAKIPEQRHIRIAGIFLSGAVNFQVDHWSSS